MTIIRDATIDDFEALIALGEVMSKESVEEFPPVEIEHARKYFEMSLTLPNMFLHSIAEKDGVPIGMMTAVAGPHSFSSRIRTSSDLLFVLPEHRGGMAAVKLMKRYKDWSKSLNAAYSYISVSTGVTPEKTTKFYEFMGFRPMEMMYRRDYVYRD